MTRQHPIVESFVRRAIYDGRDKIGDIETRGTTRSTEFVARDKRGNVVGTFDTVIEAANAIAKAGVP
jgi:hypothetical protein